MGNYFNLKKAIPICGISILDMPGDKSIEFALTRNINGVNYTSKYNIVTKKQFKDIYSSDGFKFFNKFEYEEYDIVVLYESLKHNSEEIIDIKYVLTSLYFANRLICEDIEFESCEVFYNISEEWYTNKESDFIQLRVPIKIGPKQADKNNYNESISRLYGMDLEGEYANHNRYLSTFSFRNSKLFIQYNEKLQSEINNICNKLNDNSDYSRKIKSAFRLYFDTIPEYDIDKNIISYGTVFETLLLERDEDNQRKKVSIRTMCLLCEGLSLKEKDYILDVVYNFYRYRNKLVHDGYSYLELGEYYYVNKVLNCIKHIIYFLIKKIICKDIKDVKEIKSIVNVNMQKDGMKNAFDYIKDDTNIDKVMSRIINSKHREFIKANTYEEKERYKLALSRD